MGNQGYLALILHSHLPYVRHPEHERFLEEDWLYEAITETYLPLLQVFENLARDKIPLRLTMVLTPTLLSMLADELLCRRYRLYLGRLIELATSEVRRTRNDRSFENLARMYLDRFKWARNQFEDVYACDLIGAFGRLQDEGHLELITSAATHAYLPLYRDYPQAVAAQVRVAVETHRQLLSRPPRGFWLPECGYYPGLDGLLAEHDLDYFFCDTHGLLHAEPRPLYGAYAPILCPSGPAVFARDRWSSKQVWSAEEGYPGDPEYREFYHDIGHQLDVDYLLPYIQPTGQRKHTGIKYHRITGGRGKKEPYRPELASRKAADHAANFVVERTRQVSMLYQEMGQRPPIVVCPYDAELFGHWWFEGPQFLEFLFRNLAATRPPLHSLTPSEFLKRHPVHQISTPAASSWGHKGYSEVWLNDSNDWIYPHIHWATGEMIRLSVGHPDPPAPVRRALNQAARELMLAQSSDWAFIMKTGTMVEYAVRRTEEHLLAFRQLRDQIVSGRIDNPALADLEKRHNIFPNIDFRCYRLDYTG